MRSVALTIVLYVARAAGKWITGIIWLLTVGLPGPGIVYDYWTLNEQIAGRNRIFQ